MAPLRKKPRVYPYTPEKLTVALDAIAKGMAKRKAARVYGIPYSTLQKKVSGVLPWKYYGRGGYHSSLGEEFEQKIVNWIIQMARKGFPVSKDDLLCSVEKMINDLPAGSLKRTMKPGNTWYYHFLRRHPEISRKKCEHVSRARGKVTRENIETWFENVEKDLGSFVEILQYPERVWNMDESGFTLTTDGQYVLAEKGKHVYNESKHSNKECITTLFAVNASGTFALPMTLFSYKRLPSDAYDNAPLNWSIGKSENGWMDGASFYEYFGNVFLPFLKEQNIQRPVIVFLDGHSSHMTLHLSDLCVANDIILVALYPNSTHILQPLDVSVFKAIKTRYNALKKKARHARGIDMEKFEVPIMLSQIIEAEGMKKNIINGFAATGLCPFDVSAVDYSRVIDREPVRPLSEAVSRNVQTKTPTNIEYFESQIHPDLLIQFQADFQDSGEWTGDIRNEGLFQIWKKMKSEMEKHAPQGSTSAADSSTESFVIWPERNEGEEEPVQPSVLTTPAWREIRKKKLAVKEELARIKIENKRKREEKKKEIEALKDQKRQERKAKKVERLLQNQIAAQKRQVLKDQREAQKLHDLELKRIKKEEKMKQKMEKAKKNEKKVKKNVEENT